MDDYFGELVDCEKIEISDKRAGSSIKRNNVNKLFERGG